MVQVYESQNGLILSRYMLNHVPSGSPHQRKRKRQDSTGVIFAASGIISLAGQQNPTCGTTGFFDAIRETGNPHEISDLRWGDAFGTAAAKRFRVVEFPSRPHYVQFSLSLL
jgi:hypothetical protein